MPHSQRSGRLRTTRRARRPDGGIYRTLRMRRGGPRPKAGVWIASGILLLLIGLVWLLLWR